MKAMIEEMVKGLVDSPESVRINEVASPGMVTYEVTVDEKDLGKVIGRDGRIAGALRVIARAIAARDKRDAQVEIMS